VQVDMVCAGTHGLCRYTWSVHRAAVLLVPGMAGAPGVAGHVALIAHPSFSYPTERA